MSFCKMSKSYTVLNQKKDCWTKRKQIVAGLAISLIVIPMLTCLNSKINGSGAVVYNSNSQNPTRIFAGFGLHRLTEFPWYATSNIDDVVFENDSILKNIELRGTRKLPHALIIGAKKAGTRALLEFIRVHPNVRAAGHEVHFFDKNYSLGLEWYRSMMPASIDGQITIEKTPSYLITQQAPRRVFEMDSSVKLVVVVKDPVVRAISDYTQSSTKRRRRKSFEDFVLLDSDGTDVNSSRSLIKTGLYIKHLEKWMAYFSPNQFCFINGENLITNPAAELKKLQDFLGLRQIITEDHFYFNSTKGFPCLKKREASGVPHCLGEGKGRVHPVVSAKIKLILYEYFRPFNEAFYKQFNIDFKWEKNSPTEG